MASEDLTGRTRHRMQRFKEGWHTYNVLVLQVEYHNSDCDFSPSSTLWRDARVEDLAMLDYVRGNPPIPPNPQPV